MKVLLLEDNPQNIESLKIAITNACPDAEITVMTEIGANFYGYTGADKAVKLALYDAVITDVNMPAYTDSDGMMMSPIGPVVALKALQAGVKGIAVLTDANHHEGNPVSKAADLFMEVAAGEADCIIGDTKFTYRNINKTDIKRVTRTLQWLFEAGNERFIPWAKANQ